MSNDSTPRWDISRVAPPWGDRPSIYQHIRAHLPAEGPDLCNGGRTLPDQREREACGDIIYISLGTLDAIVKHHGDDSGADAEEIPPREAGVTPDAIEELYHAVRNLTEASTDANAAACYALIKGGGIDDLAPKLVRVIRERGQLDLSRLHAIGQWLTTGAADRCAVEFGIGLFNLCYQVDDRELLLTLGRHEKFTNAVIGVLTHASPRAELDLWALAKATSYWERIELIEETLQYTDNPAIKAWMLREGYQNKIMNEYTALYCAEGGGLLEALRAPHPDEALLIGAGEIIGALIAEGPVAGVSVYPDGPAVMARFLEHLLHQPVNLVYDRFACVIHHFVSSAEIDERPRLVALGWPQRRASIQALTQQMFARPELEACIRAALSDFATDPQRFQLALYLAGEHHVDAWDIMFDRLQRGDDLWMQAMCVVEPERMAQVLALAEQRLGFAAIGAEPRHQAPAPGFYGMMLLHSLVDQLARFPGLGWSCVRANLHSHRAGNRQAALHTLAVWGQAYWPAEVVPCLQAVLEEEQEEEVRATIGKVLRGEAIEE